MREIKFRAWDKSQEIMSYPFDLFEILGLDDGTLYVPGPLGDHELGGENVVLMQFTGLKDKNGREIYEGDVVRCLDTYDKDDIEENWRGEVKFGRFNCHCCDGIFGFYIDGGNIRQLEETPSVYEIEVIGNIYENPDLIPKHLP